MAQPEHRQAGPEEGLGRATQGPRVSRGLLHPLIGGVATAAGVDPAREAFDGQRRDHDAADGRIRIAPRDGTEAAPAEYKGVIRL